MNQKKTEIIQKAIHLFATEGFHPTSIQDICTVSGISKGAFYLHFDSKDQLLVEIYEYYYESLYEQVQQVKEQAESPYESFLLQLEAHYETIFKHRDFIIMQLQEQELSTNPAIRSFVTEMKEVRYDWFKKNFTILYGEEVEPYVYDLSILLEGMNKAYLQTILYLELDINPKDLAVWILDHLNDHRESLLVKRATPFFTSDILQEKHEEKHDKELSEVIQSVVEVIDELNAPEEKVSEWLEALDVLSAEAKKDQPRAIIIQGMLKTLEDAPDMEFYCKRLEQLTIR
ncbi:hypothetical protein DH09_13405 [Bacillaceae bacterium JMAK1]|nr:hypothetical protein DH09_13405 [Bacillaceae bacterium JMAK1]